MFRKRRNHKDLWAHFASAVFGASAAVFVQSEFTKAQQNEPKSGFFDLISKALSKHVFGKPKIMSNHDDRIENDEISILAPTSPIIIFRPNTFLEIAYDTRSKNPVYVLERLLPRSQRISSEAPVTRDGMNFFEEKTLPTMHRSRNGYYRHSGYDRGHHAPAADFTMSEKHMKDTFNLSNISPQTPILNRKVWSRLEILVRQLVDEAEESTTNQVLSSYVITGPLWLPDRILPSKTSGERSAFQYSFVGLGTPPSLLQVPTHFFKVVATLSHDEGNNKPTHVRKIAAFVLPNTNFDRLDSINLQDFSVKLSDLEAVSGMLFFQNIWKGAMTEETVDYPVNDMNPEKIFIDLTTEKLKNDNSSQQRLSMGSADANAIATMSTFTTDMTRVSKDLRDLSKQISKRGVPIPEHYCQKNSCDVVVKL